MKKIRILVFCIIGLLCVSVASAGILDSITGFFSLKNLFTAQKAISSCSDTDGGLNYGVKGTACEGTKCSEDYCQDLSHLFEMDCGTNAGIPSSHNGLGGGRHSCSSGTLCLDGACTEETVAQQVALPPSATLEQAVAGVSSCVFVKPQTTTEMQGKTPKSFCQAKQPGFLPVLVQRKHVYAYFSAENCGGDPLFGYVDSVMEDAKDINMLNVISTAGANCKEDSAEFNGVSSSKHTYTNIGVLCCEPPINTN
ncbi:MAG: hypothetical protein V1914_03550 [archaeon]